ncbi:MAG TPA: copper chaperone PCu(A)C [Reyranella sp.]|nr:copper chaperone PCu(A)C [Reyranella sp.]
MNLSLRLSFLALLVAFLPNLALAQDYKLGSLVISHAWARATAPSAPAGAGYLTITNTGTTADRLVSARSPVAGSVQVHEMKMEGSVMRMRELEHGLDIPAGATVTLAPEHFHLMIMSLKNQLKQGERMPMTLTFEKAGSIDIELAVESIGATKPSH